MSLTNPLNLLLMPPIIYLIARIVYPSLPEVPPKLPSTYSEDTYNWLPASHPDVIVHKKYTAKELEQYDGKRSKRILLAIMRVGRDGKIPKKGEGKGERTVFDVTAGGTFYGPDGMYGNFAGRDASRGMAKQSFELDTLTPVTEPLDTLSDLTPSEIDNMSGWHEHFERKYIVCGELVDEDEE